LKPFEGAKKMRKLQVNWRYKFNELRLLISCLLRSKGEEKAGNYSMSENSLEIPARTETNRYTLARYLPKAATISMGKRYSMRSS